MIAEQTIRVSTGYNPRPWQETVHKGKGRVRFSVLVVHRRGGKTVLAINELVDEALKNQRPEPRYAYIAPFLKQARDIAWDYLKQYTKNLHGVDFHESLLEIRLPNGARIRLYGADNPDSLRGIYLDGVVLDEVADMEPAIWGEVLRPTLADRTGWAMFIGTPKGINLFSELYFAAVKDPKWYAGLFTYRETNALPPEEIELARSMMTDRQFRQEFECDFQAGADDTLISLDLARAATNRHPVHELHSYAPMVFGIDVARYGDDRTVVFPRKGLIAFEPRVVKGLETNEVVSVVAAEAAKHKPKAIFVDTGGNPGIFDNLRSLGYPVRPVDFGSKPGDEAYQNKRVEMWVAMRDWLKEGGSIPNNQDLLIDLCGPKFTFKNVRGKMQLESKDDMRKRGMKSTDLGDALCCTFAFPMAPLGAEPFVRKGNNNYDPLSEKYL